jgi:SAM-dependent methyltransferase
VDRLAYAEMYEQEDVHWWFRGRRDVIWALIGHTTMVPSPRLLDAGCGTGRNLVEFGSLGPATGVDPSSDAVTYCHERGLVDVRQAGLESLPFPDGSFDLLLACDVIEHVADDIGALGELYRVAAPGAALVLTVPAYRWLWTDHDIQLHHLRRYTLGVLRSRVVAAGWEPVRATYFNSLMLPMVAGARLASRVVHRRARTDLDRTPAHLNGVLAAPMRLEAMAIRHGVRLPAGVSVGMVCAKAR